MDINNITSLTDRFFKIASKKLKAKYPELANEIDSLGESIKPKYMAWAIK